MKVEEVRNCSFENWYDAFRPVTIRSIILPLPESFVSYILTDGIVLPKNSKTYSTIKASDSSDSEEDDAWDDVETDEPEAPHFPDFDDSIKDAIEKLGGKVFPKLNWSSPRDASWIAFNNSCCCTSVSDIYLLLKSSDFIIHDLTQRFNLCEDYVSDNNGDSKLSPSKEKFYLVLRKWTDIDTSGEFRCFVKDDKLIGICQREHSSYYDHICYHQEEIVEDIVSFFQTSIQSKFCCNYVFDIYRRRKGKVYLIDFNPFGVVTDSLLFSWNELKKGAVRLDENELPEFRFVHDNHGVQPRTLSHHALPKDIIDMSSGEDSFKLVDLLKLKIDEQNKVLSDDENEENWEV